MWTTSFYFGNFLGPTLAGVAVQAWGFRWAAASFALLYALAAFFDGIAVLRAVCRRHRRVIEGYSRLN